MSTAAPAAAPAPPPPAAHHSPTGRGAARARRRRSKIEEALDEQNVRVEERRRSALEVALGASPDEDVSGFAEEDYVPPLVVDFDHITRSFVDARRGLPFSAFTRGATTAAQAEEALQKAEIDDFLRGRPRYALPPRPVTARPALAVPAPAEPRSPPPPPAAFVPDPAAARARARRRRRWRRRR